MRSRLDHLEVYVSELERELLHHKELLERERVLRREVERQNRVLQIRLDRVAQKRVFLETAEKQHPNSFKEELESFSTMIDSRIQRLAEESSTIAKDSDRINLIENFAVFGVPEVVIM